MNKDIDGRPVIVEQSSVAARYIRPSKRLLARKAMRDAVSHFEEGNGEGLVTWVDTEHSWDGHALVLTELSPEKIALKYFHVDRTEEQLMRQSVIEVSISEDASAEEALRSVDIQVETIKNEFDRETLTYIIAMIDKIARNGVINSQEKADKIVKHTIYEEHLDTLAALYPTNTEKDEESGKNHLSPFLNPKLREAMGALAKREKVGKNGGHVYLQRIFNVNDERYAVSIFLDSDGKPVNAYFLQQQKGQWLGEIFDYTDVEMYTKASEYDWDESKLLRTIETGLPLSEDAFDIYAQESYDNETGDFTHLDDDL